MLASDIIEVIERRRARFLEKCHFASAANLSEGDLVNLRITEEYDSLMAEVEAIRKAKLSPHAPGPAMREDLEDRSEEWILGDQGQSGG